MNFELTPDHLTRTNFMLKYTSNLLLPQNDINQILISQQQFHNPLTLQTSTIPQQPNCLCIDCMCLTISNSTTPLHQLPLLTIVEDPDYVTFPNTVSKSPFQHDRQFHEKREFFLLRQKWGSQSHLPNFSKVPFLLHFLQLHIVPTLPQTTTSTSFSIQQQLAPPQSQPSPLSSTPSYYTLNQRFDEYFTLQRTQWSYLRWLDELCFDLKVWLLNYHPAFIHDFRTICFNTYLYLLNLHNQERLQYVVTLYEFLQHNPQCIPPPPPLIIQPLSPQSSLHSTPSLSRPPSTQSAPSSHNHQLQVVLPTAQIQYQSTPQQQDSINDDKQQQQQNHQDNQYQIHDHSNDTTSTLSKDNNTKGFKTPDVPLRRIPSRNIAVYHVAIAEPENSNSFHDSNKNTTSPLHININGTNDTNVIDNIVPTLPFTDKKTTKGRKSKVYDFSLSKPQQQQSQPLTIAEFNQLLSKRNIRNPEQRKLRIRTILGHKPVDQLIYVTGTTSIIIQNDYESCPRLQESISTTPTQYISASPRFSSLSPFAHNLFQQQPPFNPQIRLFSIVDWFRILDQIEATPPLDFHPEYPIESIYATMCTLLEPLPMINNNSDTSNNNTTTDLQQSQSAGIIFNNSSLPNNNSTNTNCSSSQTQSQSSQTQSQPILQVLPSVTLSEELADDDNNHSNDDIVLELPFSSQHTTPKLYNRTFSLSPTQCDVTEHDLLPILDRLHSIDLISSQITTELSSDSNTNSVPATQWRSIDSAQSTEYFYQD